MNFINEWIRTVSAVFVWDCLLRDQTDWLTAVHWILVLLYWIIMQCVLCCWCVWLAYDVHMSTNGSSRCFAFIHITNMTEGHLQHSPTIFSLNTKVVRIQYSQILMKFQFLFTVCLSKFKFTGFYGELWGVVWNWVMLSQILYFVLTV